MRTKNAKKIWLLVLPTLLLVIPNNTYAVETDEHVDFAANIEFIRGHLLQAVADKQQNELELAKAHAGHPISELYALIEGEIKEYNMELESSLKTALEQLPSKVDSLTATEFAAEIANIETMLDDAMNAVPQAKKDDHVFWIKVAIQLLETAEHEYEEAVSGGKITEMIEYQDAQGFVGRADALFKSIANKIDEEERNEIDESFTELKEAMESAKEPADIETFIGGIVYEFKEVAGIEEEMSMTKQASVANIKALLANLIEEYEEGEYEEAEQLAIKAYVDNYEFLEPAIEEKDPELMETTEIMMREELRSMIKDRAPLEQIESKVEQINVNLDKILALGIGVAEEAGDPRLAYVQNIRMILAKAVEEYEEGEYEEALSFAIKAYLDNYEFIERDVDAQDEELNEDMEQLLRDELQEKIRNRAPVSEVKALASEINAKLDAVEVIVPEFPLGLALVMASIVGTMVVLTRAKKLSLP